MKKTILTATILLLSTVLCSAVFAANDSTQKTEAGVERYAIYIGSNYGGKDREKLLYAGSDAQNFQKTMAEIGGVPEKNSWLLIDPSKETVEEAIESVSAKIEKKNNLAKRSEFLFYYSGHSTEDELLLGDDKYDYSSLKKAITDVPSDIHVVILDSCYSGNFIRTKGGQKKKPFLMDDSSVVKGHAYLSSSSEKESSQESDEIESSFFTNAMITGLRGAADTSGDNKVSLTELYSYAFNDTLSKTEESVAGPQHPNYNITLVGSGDLILSDISSAESSVVIAKEAEGRFIIRDARGKLISEINKSKGVPITMALSAGTYTVVVITETSTKQGTFILNVDDTFLIEESGMQKVTRKQTTQRGGTKLPETFVNVQDDSDEDLTDEEYDEYVAEDDEEFLPFTVPGSVSDYADDDDNELLSFSNGLKLIEDDDSDSDGAAAEDVPAAVKTNASDEKNIDDVILAAETEGKKKIDGFPLTNIFVQFAQDKGFVPFQISFTSTLDFLPVRKKTTLFGFGLIGTSTKNILGFQTAPVTACADENFVGLQTSGIYAYAGNGLGLQTAGIYAGAGNFTGVQTSGLVAHADTLRGVQTASLVNTADKAYGIQTAGLVNSADDAFGIQTAGLVNTADRAYGIQAAGLVNHAKNVKGIQTAGLVSSASSVCGLQVSALVNYAETLNGLQVGLINVSKDGYGFAVGLINYTENGVHDFGILYDSDSELMFQYQSGYKFLFTTAGVGIPVTKKGLFSNDVNLAFVGLGTRLGWDDSSLDVEFLWKVSSTDMWSLHKSVSSCVRDAAKWGTWVTVDENTFKVASSFYKTIQVFQIPALRVTWNLDLGKHFSIFAGATADIRIKGWNDKAFEGYSRTWNWDVIYPSVSCGVKIR